MSQYFNLSFSSSQGPQVTISKNAWRGPCKHAHYFNTGGSSADMDAKYKGPCCGGTKQWGLAPGNPNGLGDVLPNGERVSGPWHLMTYDFQMKPGAGLVPQPMMAAE